MQLGRKAKNAVLSGCQYFGVNALARAISRDKLLVLCYHGVIENHQEDRFGYGNTVSAREFSDHLEILARRFHPVSVADVIAAHGGGASLPHRAALVTFDDGYRNNLTVAADILLQKGVPCVFHVSTGYIGTRRILWPDEVVNLIIDWPSRTLPLPNGSEQVLPVSFHERRELAWKIKEGCKSQPFERVEAYVHKLRQAEGSMKEDDELYGFMDWEEVRALNRKGFEIGSHTIDHPILTRIDPSRLDHELTESKHRIEAELGEECPCIAYPNGGSQDVSVTVFEAARRAGYKLGFTVAEQHSRPGEDRFAVSRICVQGHLPVSFFEWRASGTDVLCRGLQ